MKRLIIIIVMLILGLEYSNAQQLPQFALYMYNTIVINPAYAVSRDALSIVALNRKQWAGFDGRPQTQTLSIPFSIGSGYEPLTGYIYLGTH